MRRDEKSGVPHEKRTDSIGYYTFDGGVFTSCENFLSGEKIKQEIEDQIALANAPAFPIQIDGTKGKFSPAKGSYPLKVTQSMDISFESDSDFEFIRWEVFNTVTGESLDTEEYIEFKDSMSDKTSFKLLKEPGSEIQLGVRSIVSLRPQIISWSPLGSGMFKDSSIQVLFDTEMNPLSIYYTKEEMDAMLVQDATIEPLYEEGNVDEEGNQLYYGYIQDGQRYFKNILITNKKTGENITECFDAPVFENASTLTIPANNDERLLDDYTQVIVTIGDEMYFTSQGKDISLGGIKKWLYQVSNTTDNLPLALEKTSGTVNFSMELNDSKVKNPAKLANFSINQTTGTGISNLEGFYVNNSFANAALNLRFKVLESGMGSGPKDFFTIYYRKAYDADYKPTGASFTTQTVDYNSVTSEEAFFEGSVVLKNLETINDGVYEMYFSFDDKSGNRLYYPSNTSSATSKYYFVKDRKTPTISNLKISSNNSTDYNLSWDCPLDIKTSAVSIKKNGGTATTQSTSRGTHTVSGIEKNIKYDIELSVTDYAGNTKTATVPKFLTGFELAGALSMGATGVSFEGDTIDKYGLSAKKYYSDKTSVDVSSSYKIPAKDDYTNNSLTISVSCAEESVSKSTSGTYSCYTVKADALTQSPVKISYSGAVSGTYYKFGDYPQSLSKISEYTSSAVYNGWYIGKDGYFYERSAEKAHDSQYCYAGTTTKVGTGGTSSKYFKVEPVVWRKLTSNYAGTGNALLFAEKILVAIDYLERWPSQGVRTVNGESNVFTSNYKYSSLRAFFNNLYFVDTSGHGGSTNDWGSNGFLKKAFTTTAQGKIATTTVDNSAASTMLYGNPKSYNNGNNPYAVCGSTSDKIFALSWCEMSNPNYGFKNNQNADNARVRWPTDYALAKGAYKKKPAEQSGGYYWTRSPDEDEGKSIRDVDWDGHDNSERIIKFSESTDAGAVPALTISNSYLP